MEFDTTQLLRILIDFLEADQKQRLERIARIDEALKPKAVEVKAIRLKNKKPPLQRRGIKSIQNNFCV